MLKGIITLIWLIDIINVQSNINGFNIGEFLDTGITINTVWWLLYWILGSGALVLKVVKKEDDE